MLKIGYVRLWDAARNDDMTQLKAAGCQVVRTEDLDGDTQVLDSILDFVGGGDELMVARLDRIGSSSRDLLRTLDRLDARGANLRVLHPDLSSQGASGRALRAVLEATSDLGDGSNPRRRPAAAAEIFELQRAGVGPVEIARRLGVSRMTVWRKLKALETAQP